jgi:hypothetical protein
MGTFQSSFQQRTIHAKTALRQGRPIRRKRPEQIYSSNAGRCIQNFGWKNHFGDISADARIMQMFILEKQIMSFWDGFSWLGIGQTVRFC